MREKYDGAVFDLFVELYERLPLGFVIGGKTRLLSGALIACVSAGLWVLTEESCATSDFFKVFPGHPIWHIGMPLGLMHCLSFCALLRAEAHGQFPYYSGGVGPLCGPRHR